MRLRWWVLIGILIAGFGGLGMWVIVTQVWPNPITELIVLGLLALTLLGLTIPVAAYFNHRFGRTGWQKRDPQRLLRQGAWVGLLGALYGWLRKEGALNWTIVAVIAGVFVLLEAFFLTRDQA